MADRTPDTTIPGLTVAELRVRLDVLNNVLTELVDRTVRAESEEAGLLRIALELAQAIAGRWTPKTGQLAKVDSADLKGVADRWQNDASTPQN